MKILFLILYFNCIALAQSKLLLMFEESQVGAIPNYDTTTAIGTGTTSLDLIYPANITAGDILIAQIEVDDAQNAPTITPPEGWVKGDSVISGTYTRYKFAWYWKRADGTETGNASFAGGGNEMMKGIMSKFSGCIATGNPYESIANSGVVISGTLTSQEITTLGANRLAVCLALVLDDNTLSANMTNYATLFSGNSLVGSPDGQLIVFGLDVAVAGTIAADSATNSASDAHAIFTFALIPE